MIFFGLNVKLSYFIEDGKYIFYFHMPFRVDNECKTIRMKLQNKVFVVSGAASGLGQATTEHLIRHGARVVALDVHSMEDQSWIGEIEKVRYYQCDVRKVDQVRDVVEAGKNDFGALHGVIACAGVAPAAKIHSSRTGSHSAEVFVNTIEINLAGTFHLFNACVPLIKENTPLPQDEERGVLIATSSIAAYEGQIGQSAYAASKGGVASMILPMARELARTGIRVNAIAPGIFETPMVAGFSPEIRASLEANVPFPRRLGRPQEFARLVEHLITNTYINGTVIRLDGGVRMG